MFGKTFKKDVEQAISDQNIPWRDLSGASVLVTGVTGLIGSALVRVLASANEEYMLNLRIIGHGRDAAKGKKLCQGFDIEFISSDICRAIPTETLPPTLDYIFHGASITKSADMVANPVNVITTAFEGTQNALKLAVERRCRSFVYLSSMEVYGQAGFEEVCESDLGYIDLSNPRSSYPASKRMCECLCAAFGKQYFVPVKIARLAQTFGAGTQQNDTRVFAQFARSAMSGSNIVLHTDGKSRGNYCYTTDTVRGLLTLALKGTNGETYNVAHPSAAMTIKGMAELVARDVCGERVEVVIKTPTDIQKRGYAPDASYKLNADKLMSLGWLPQYGLVDMYKRMILDWREK